ncbi:MAG: NADH-quinone oxidoreductase subunit M [Isosphaeraceae bacterium]
MSDSILLTALWALPLAGSLAVLAIPRKFEPAIRGTALATCLLTLVLSLLALRSYAVPPANLSSPIDISMETRCRANQPTIGIDGRPQANDVPNDLAYCTPWISSFHIQYYVGLDGISLSLVVLTGLVATLACLASWAIDKQVKAYFSLFLLLLASLMGVFLALDLILFYIFFELMLLPMYFLIGIWGGEHREYAAMKFLLYTLFGSVFILIAILLLYFWSGDASDVEVYDQAYRAHTFDIMKLASAATTGYYGRGVQQAIFLLFLIGFLVKLPSFPFHTWLPDAHVQAPTPISMILAGVLLKVGGYGLLRLAWPLAPAGAQSLAWYVAALGVFSILYGALAAMAQSDFKKLVAYSSVSHMGYVTLGMAAMQLSPDPSHYAYGVGGALFMMIAHGITSTAMFFLVGVIYERAHTRDLDSLGGLFHPMPGYAAVSALIFFGSMGLPGLCGFVAEVFVILASFNFSIPLAILAASAVVLTAGYILWTLQRVFLGRNEKWGALPDLDAREWTIAVPLVALTILLGVFPQQFLLEWAGPSIRETVARISAGSMVAEEKAQVAMIADQSRPSPE